MGGQGLSDTAYQVVMCALMAVVIGQWFVIAKLLDESGKK